jgi:hypothetical protein
VPSRNSFQTHWEPAVAKNHICVEAVRIYLWIQDLLERRLQLARGQVFTTASRHSYSPIPKLSIWVAACSANFNTFPEYVWQLGVLVPRTHPLYR